MLWQGLCIDHTKFVFVSFLILSGVLASVSSVQLKYVYKSSGMKQAVSTTKQASLIESLTSSEVKLMYWKCLPCNINKYFLVSCYWSIHLIDCYFGIPECSGSGCTSQKPRAEGQRMFIMLLFFFASLFRLTVDVLASSRSVMNNAATLLRQPSLSLAHALAWSHDPHPASAVSTKWMSSVWLPG